MRVIGMMSGTSIDGIDIAIADITESTVPIIDRTNIEESSNRTSRERLTTQSIINKEALTNHGVQIQQVAFATIPWQPELRNQLFALIQEPTTAAALCQANFLVAEHFADAALNFLTTAGIALETIDLIASHGQTIWHEVVNGQVTSTLQIGDPSVIAVRTGITTIGNFRTADVAAGGQGAPLVSLLDWLLLRPSTGTQGWRAVQNIGGIGNVTFLPPYGNSQLSLAFDTGPGNVYIDWAAVRATDGRLTYDVDGSLAAAGTVSQTLLERWLTLPYFAQHPPKSTGRELFSHTLIEEWWIDAQQEGIAPIDFVATVTELTAATIAEAYRRFLPETATGNRIADVVVAGGGARNPTLLARLATQLKERLGYDIHVHTHADLGIDDKAKEALAFALMGTRTLQGSAGNVPSCTGAIAPQILGQIAPGKNYQQVLQELTHGNSTM